MDYKIRTVDHDNVGWSFGSEGPVYIYGPQGRTELDPFPCYSHNVELVADIMNDLVERAPLDVPVEVHVSGFDDTHHTNGWATYTYTSDFDKQLDKWTYDYTGHIFLSGKRTPLHRAMTRFVLPHEYGHNFMYALERVRDQDDMGVMLDYCKMRGIENNMEYGARRWHLNAKEVFACDFRLWAGYEKEHWPHPGIDLPDAKTKRWFSKAAKEIAK